MDEPGPIYKSTKACRDAFTECQNLPELLDGWDIEERQAEFNWWTVALLADSIGQASLDHRLRGRPDIEKVVLGLVDGITRAVKTSATIGKCTGSHFPQYLRSPR